MCPTPLGRIQTRTFILLAPALLGLVLSLVSGNEGYIVLIGVYLLMGVTLDVLFYPRVVKWQPPWLTFVLAVGEFVLLYVLAQVLEVGLEPVTAVWFFWASWVLAIVTKIVVLPIVSLTWIENGGEFRATGWSIPPASEPVPVVGTLPTGGDVAPLAREFSSVNEIPAELRNLPSPSGVHRRPGAATR